MQHKLITKQIIVNFFEGKCDARDVAIVQAWLKENPARLKEYIGAEEWERFQPARMLSPEVSENIWNNIAKNTTPAETHRPYWKWTAVAASIVLLIGLSWHFVLTGQKTGISSTAPVAKTRQSANTTPQRTTLTLSDGSTVELSPNSTLSYPENFGSSKRDVLLNGEAIFTITKDAAKPFYVHSNSVLITVLGTRFTVRAYEANNASVILHEGSVMVKIPDSGSKNNKKEYYLSPGDIFVFKKVKKEAPAPNTEPIATRKAIATDSLSARILHLEKDKDDCYVFDNYPLDVVFDQLQIIYNTRIVYNKAELGNRSFIGKIDKKDSLYHLLKSIALLNNFGLRKQGDSIVISN